ncbi:hypothetical protein GJ496_002813 [Pomphorhynchus laevis]|nr:hypothetical protein GJ496_002813 [Pomphorhynchus laevis]
MIILISNFVLGITLISTLFFHLYPCSENIQSGKFYSKQYSVINATIGLSVDIACYVGELDVCPGNESIVWYFISLNGQSLGLIANGHYLLNRSYRPIFKIGDSNSLTVYNVSIDDCGWFECRYICYPSEQRISSITFLDVHPEIVNKVNISDELALKVCYKQKLIFMVNLEMKLHCKFDINQVFVDQLALWYKDGELLSGADSYQFWAWSGNPTLSSYYVIERSKFSDTGEYECIFKNFSRKFEVIIAVSSGKHV